MALTEVLHQRPPEVSRQAFTVHPDTGVFLVLNTEGKAQQTKDGYLVHTRVHLAVKGEERTVEDRSYEPDNYKALDTFNLLLQEAISPEYPHVAGTVVRDTYEVPTQKNGEVTAVVSLVTTDADVLPGLGTGRNPMEAQQRALLNAYQGYLR